MPDVVSLGGELRLTGGRAPRRIPVPMPLKHLTETILVVTLALVCVCTGVLLSALPPLPQGVLPWLLIFVLSLIYPLALYPLLKNNRAEYSFRTLHFLPAVLVALWLALELLGLRFPLVRYLTMFYVFGGALFGVTVSFLLLALFCVGVIRRRAPRLMFLVGLFVVFAIASLWSEGSFHGREALTAALWRGSWWDVTRPRIAQVASSSAALSSRRSIAFFQPASSQVGALSGVLVSSRRSQPPILRSSSSRPSHLPSAGPEVDGLLVTLGAFYGATLHWRAQRRVRG